MSNEEELHKAEEERLQRALQKKRNTKPNNVLAKKPVSNENIPKKEEKPIISNNKKPLSEEEKKKQEEIDKMIKERERLWEEEKEKVKNQESTMQRQMTHSNPIQANVLKVKDEESTKNSLSKLYDNNDKTNFILFQYTNLNNEIQIEKVGEGDLDELKENLHDDQIQFAIIQQEVKSDYSLIHRFALLQWIGKDVPAGMLKARASSHRGELISFCKKVVPIGGELQASSKDDINMESISFSFGSNNTSNEKSQKIENLENVKGGRGKKLDELRFDNEEQVTKVLQQIHNGEQNWAIFAYSKTQSGVIELVESGVGGAEELSKRFPTDRIYFCPISVPIKPNPKYAMVTCVGVNVPPLQKARCSGEISKVADKIKSIIPFHAYFQPIDAEDLTDNNLIRKLT